MNECRPYFAYASNMIASQMHARAPAARLVGRARLEGFAFTIAARGYASIIPTPGNAVYGLVWEITPTCERELDRHEGVGNGHYHKATVNTTTADGDYNALVYIATDPAPGKNGYGVRWPQILASARKHGFPAAYLLELETFS